MLIENLPHLTIAEQHHSHHSAGTQNKHSSDPDCILCSANALRRKAMHYIQNDVLVHDSDQL